MMDDRDDTPSAESEIWSLPVTETYRYVRHDGTERTAEFDRALWVEMNGDRGYIEGNAHTHPGRFHVGFPDHGYSTTASVSELTAMSPEARYWLVGFLSGSEPRLYEYLGLARAVEIEKFHDYEYTDEELVRWTNFCKEFRRSGWYIHPNMRPERALVITDEERAQITLDPWRPWTYVGERVLVPDGLDAAKWVEADPQPEMDGPWLAGSVCAERERCQTMWLEKSGWEVCCDCGQVRRVDWYVVNP
jgi:hypothetical protein